MRSILCMGNKGDKVRDLFLKLRCRWEKDVFGTETNRVMGIYFRDLFCCFVAEGSMMLGICLVFFNEQQKHLRDLFYVLCRKKKGEGFVQFRFLWPGRKLRDLFSLFGAGSSEIWDLFRGKRSFQLLQKGICATISVVKERVKCASVYFKAKRVIYSCF